ncbi:hypothetical protein [Desulfobulbus propionicus]|uniref:hypothetical protein n=1 Tax=Desulfobulbus propionicus TaxID=894 RepID=UPI00146B1EAD|nr:hypothetical protein [Desulfobulbus propionicus]
MNKIKAFMAIFAIFSWSFPLRRPNNDAPFILNSQQIRMLPLAPLDRNPVEVHLLFARRKNIINTGKKEMWAKNRKWSRLAACCR